MVGRWRALLVALLAGCGGDKDGGGTVDATPTDTATADTGTDGTTGDTGVPVITDLVVTDEHVYSVTAEYEVAVGTVREGWDALVTWSDLTVDAWGDPLDPVGVSVLALLEVVESPDRLGERLAADDLGNDLVATWQADVLGTTFANLSELSSGTTAFAPEAFLQEDPAKTWVLMLADADGERLVPRTFLALQADQAGDTSLVFTDGASTVNWTATLDGTPLPVTGGLPGVVVDWEGLGNDALGKPYDERLGDQLFLGRFAAPASTLGASVLTLQDTADVWYTMDVLQDTDARLELARDGAGGSFPGFDQAGTWLLGVRCTPCLTRLPLWVAVIEVQ